MPKQRQWKPVCSLRVSTAGVWKDYTKYLQSLTCHTAIGEPTGTWTGQLNGSRNDGGELVGLEIQPDSYTELRFGRDPSELGSNMPIVMRGFVDTPGFSMQASGDAVQVGISLAGRNVAGEMMLNTILAVLVEVHPEQLLGADLAMRLGADNVILSVPELIGNIVSEFVNGAGIAPRQQHDSNIPSLRVDCTVPDKYAVYSPNLFTYQGSAFNLLQEYASDPWCEFWLGDDEKGPVLLHRWAALRNSSGDLHPNVSPLPEIRKLEFDEILVVDLSKTNNEIYNYYFTDALGLFGTQYGAPSLVDPVNNPIIDQTSIALHGLRPLKPTCNVIPIDHTLAANGLEQQQQTVLQLAAELNRFLYDTNNFNEDLLSGTLTVLGRPQYRPGNYIQVDAWGLIFYVVSVDHNFSIQSHSYTTTLGVTRGQKVGEAST